MVEEDWREVRARLVAGENKDKEGASSASDTASLPAESGFVYESPLIEQGTVLLGGTKQLFGFALRQQFFHSECVCTTCVLQLLFFNCYSSTAVLQQNVFFNCCSSTECVLLLLQHDEGFTKGIILNRPTAIELDGWRLWCGHGQVAEGGMFVGADKAKGELEINCLHSLDGFMAQRVSTNVIKGVSVTSLEGAKALVAAGQAKKEDFWVTVGYSGWAPGQLQMEVDTRDSWYLASAAGDTLLRELLQQAKDLPPPSASSGAISAQALIGIDTWARLMRQIGRGADVAASEGVLADRMLAAWVRARLLPATKGKPSANGDGTPDEAPSTPSAPPPKVATGTVLCSMVPAAGPSSRILLDDQFLHKALLVVLDQGKAAEGMEELADALAGLVGGQNVKMIGGTGEPVRACVLNRPTNNLVRFNTAGNPRRRVPFCGNSPIRAGPLLAASGGTGQLWLHHRSDLGGTPLGDSGLFLLPPEGMVPLLQSGEADASDVLVISAVVEFGRAELTSMICDGEMRVVPSGAQLASLWPRVWSLTDDDGTTVDDLSDGTDVWWRASQCGAKDQLAASAPSELADEALAEWLKFFARGV